MLPGQSCDCRTAIASPAILRRGSRGPCRALTRSMKELDQRRDVLAPLGRARATRIGTTDRRWNRSSRNNPSVIELRRGRALVEDRMRTSTCTGFDVPPTRRETLIDQHAQDLRLRLGLGISATLVDDRACRRAPLRARRRGAGVSPASPSTPNSSGSIPSGVIAGALTTTNGPSLRARNASWIMRLRSAPCRSLRGRRSCRREFAGRDTLDQLAVDWFMARSRLADQLQLGPEPRVFERNSLTSRLAASTFSSARSTTRIEPVGLERLFDEVVGADFYRRHRGLDVAVAGDHHDRHASRCCCFSTSSSCRPSSFEPCIQMSRQHQAGAGAREMAASRFVRIASPCARRDLRLREDAGRRVSRMSVLVVDDENVCQPCRLTRGLG